MALMGTCGVLDHSGIRFAAALPCGGGGGKSGKAGRVVLYDSGDHDVHHMSGYGTRAVNLGFPFPVLDKLHGTYVAPHEAHAARAAGAGGGGEEGGAAAARGGGGGGTVPLRRSARTRAG
jgi:sterol desaturase/sphingolipid hydroxylase (fatty acid hydroxylase superfamily)